MTQDTLTAQLQEAVEKLAMAITYSEQGEYAKNESYVADILDTLIATAIQRAREDTEEDISKHIADDRNFDFLMSTKGKVIPFKSCGDTNCRSPYCKI